VKEVKIGDKVWIDTRTKEFVVGRKSKYRVPANARIKAFTSAVDRFDVLFYGPISNVVGEDIKIPRHK
jgi:hypothetical protein